MFRIKKRGLVLLGILHLFLLPITQAQNEPEELPVIAFPEQEERTPVGVGHATSIFSNNPAIRYWPIYLFGAVVGILLTLGSKKLRIKKPKNKVN